MAPPRQRTTAVQDDSRSEGSSTAKEVKSTAAKARKGAAGASSANAASKGSHLLNVTSAPAGDATTADNKPKINWPDMPLDILHSYRHSYKLSCPSAFTSEYSHMILSKGIGLRSPTAIAAQRSHLAREAQSTTATANGTHPSTTNGTTNGTTIPSKKPVTTNGVGRSHHNHQRPSRRHPALDGKSALNHILAQDRVTKTQLAVAVRKHFNSAGLAEQEAIARFLYKVREEGRGRQFRLRFQP